MNTPQITYRKQLKPPNRWLLRRVDRWLWPLAMFTTMLTIALALSPTPARYIAGVWLLLSIPLFITSILIYAWPNKFPLLTKLLGAPFKDRLHIVVWFWISLLIITTSLVGDPLVITFLWPAYIVPLALFLHSHHSPDNLTRYVVILVVLAVVVLATASTISYLRIADTENNTDINTLLLWIPTTISWPAFILLSIYAVVRREQLEYIRAELIQQIILDLAELEDPIASTQKIADLLFERAAIGDRVIILQYEAETDSIRVVAHAGEGAAAASGFEIPKGRGISRRAIRSMTTQIVPDVRRDRDFVEGGLPGKGSEISVPIVVVNESGSHVLGAINVQDNEPFAFRGPDAATVETLASLIGVFSNRYSERFFSALSKSLQGFYELTDPSSMIGEVVDVAHGLFEDALVCYYQLAPGTGVPLHTPYISGEFVRPIFFENSVLFSPQSNLIQWIVQWEPHFIGRISFIQSGSEFSKDFQAVEKVVSMCFLPLGAPKAKVGVLLMFFRKRNAFARMRRIELLTFAREITPHLARAEFMKAVYRGFARPQIHSHSLLGKAGLGRGAWEKILDEIQTPGLSPSSLLEKVTQLRTGFKMFLDEMRAWTATSVVSLDEMKSLEGAFDYAFGDLAQRFSGTIILREIDELVEAETDELKLILFVFITEAVRNAFLHGKTTNRVSVKIIRNYLDIAVRVEDNGEGFDPQTAIPGADGIFVMDKIGQQFLGALPIRWENTAVGQGTKLIWIIPTLPEPKALNGALEK